MAHPLAEWQKTDLHGVLFFRRCGDPQSVRLFHRTNSVIRLISNFRAEVYHHRGLSTRKDQ